MWAWLSLALGVVVVDLKAITRNLEAVAREEA
jgi:hypothetical protein